MKTPRYSHYSLVLLLFVFFNGFTQDKVDYEKSFDPLVMGEEYQNEGEFEKALEQYNKVYEGDSLFFKYALHMKMASLVQLERYEDVKAIGDKYWYFRHDLPTEFYLNYGTALDRLEEFDKSQEMYESILEEFPINHSLWYNYGVSLSLSGKHQEAYETFKKTVAINPFYDKVHLALAGIAVNEQQTTKALMALGMYMWLSVDKINNFSQLKYGNYLASSKYWSDDEFEGSNGVDLGSNSDYSSIDQLVHNYVALRDKYKTPSKLDYAFINQCHLIFSQLETINGDDEDFWYNTYSDFFGRMINEDQFAGYTYLISNYVENEKTAKIVKKKKKDALSFYGWAKRNLDEIKREVDLSFIGYDKLKVTRNESTQLIEILGDYVSNDESNTKLTGDLIIVSVNGRKSATGSFNSNGNKHGEWKYFYPNGYLKEIEVFDDAEPVDTNYSYYDNGLLRLKLLYKDGKIDGEVKLYRNGILYRTLPYTAGELKEGLLKEYHSIGTVDFSYNLKDGKSHGPFKSYFDSGEIYREGNFEEGDLDGERITYFRNGKISIKENYEAGLNQGKYLSYYQNEQLQAEGSFDEGNKIGEWTYYFQNGNKSKVQNFDENGKENGVEEEYTMDGWKLSEHSFNKGIVDSYVFYNEKGGVISEGERKGGELDYKSYFKNGNLNSEGIYNRNGRHGEWKYYDFNGTLKSSKKYIDNVLKGSFKKYFVNGNIEITYDYNEEGNSEGYYQNYYRKGDLYRQGYLKDGEMDGPWRDYYRNSKVSKEYFYSDQKREGFVNYYGNNGNPIRSSYYESGLEKFTIYYDTAGVAFDTIYEVPGKRKVELKRCKTCPVFMEVDVVNNRYHGKQLFTFPNGKLNAVGQVFNNQKNGGWKSFHPNGKTSTEGEYEYGDKVGLWKYYNIYGTMTSQVNYKNGKRHGERITYNEEGKVDFEANYFYGDLHGEVIYYVGDKTDHKREYNYGYINNYSYIKNGKEVKFNMENETAEVKTYWDNGKLAREFKVERGWFQGPYKTYYPNGQIEADQTYLNDRREGAYKMYYKNGELKIETSYIDGEIDGKYEVYYPSGKSKEVFNYLNGELQGWTTYFNEDGSIYLKILYINGNVIQVEND
jgi:antitoxin component YwqK of YwqJK toxin-antitoxin module